MTIQEELISTLQTATTFYESIGAELPATEANAAIRYLRKHGIPTAETKEREHLQDVIGHFIDQLEQAGCHFSAEELRLVGGMTSEGAAN